MSMAGLITFHAAYNFGSMLQALATQIAVESVLGNNELDIINYRPVEQKNYYNHLYRIHSGFRTFLKDVYQAPLHKARKERRRRFEDFMAQYMHLSQEFQDPGCFAMRASDYQLVISGSDQIWNKHSNELRLSTWNYMEPYLLSGYEGKRISYASSIGNMSDAEIDQLIPYLEKYEHIMVRESFAAEAIGSRLGKEIPVVVDPTLLLDRQDWINKLSLRENAKYNSACVYYSLDGVKQQRTRIPTIASFAKKRGLDKLIVITPFSGERFDDDFIELHPEFGPLDFLEALLSCSLVFTDSYHGTMFSINFHKDFYCIIRGAGVEYRKTEVLHRLGLESRVVTNDGFISGHLDAEASLPDYLAPLSESRCSSFAFLRKAIL